MKVYTSSGYRFHAQRRQELAGLLHFLHPLDQLAHPHDTLVVGARTMPRLPVFVLPVRGNALLGDTVHLLRSDLHLERLAGVNHAGVQDW